MATIPEPPEDADDPTFLDRLRQFLWLWSGMFSVAALGLAFTGYFTLGAIESATSNFLAAVASAGLFGLATLLKFGPATA